MSSIFLNADEVRELTGFAIKTKQIEQLRRMGIAFFVNGSGRPIVTVSAIEGSKQPNRVERSEIGRTTTLEWLKQNINSFIFPKHEILERAVPFVFEDLSRESGVYFLISDEILYVGVSTDPPIRILSHLRNGIRFSRFFFIPAHEMLMRYIETIYIHAIRPPLNADYPPVYEFKEQVLKLSCATK